MTPATRLIYGLGLQTNLSLAGLAGLSDPGRVDVTFTLGALPPELDLYPDGPLEERYASTELDEHGRASIQVSRLLDCQFFRIAYGDGTVVVIDSEGRRVWATWPDTATVEDTATYLLGPTLGFVLRLRGITCLHGSAINVDGRAVALVGPSGAGKSTMAAAFAKLGYPVLTDDVLALADHGDFFGVQPAYPRVRLWPESVQLLFGSPEALPRITPTWEKRFLALDTDGYRFQTDPLPLGAIYFLDERSDSQSTPHVGPMGTRDGLMALVSDTYTTYLLDGPMRAREFELLGRLVKQAPLRRVATVTRPAQIPGLCEAILRDYRDIRQRAP